MKKIRLFMQTGILLGLMFLFACTEEFKEINTDKAGISDEDLEADFANLGIPLNIIQEGIYFNYDWGQGKNWPYQLMQNLSADMFSGYMHDYKPLNGGSHNSDYNLQDGWNGTFWENIYAYIFPQIKKSEEATKQIMPPFYAITKILKVEVLHRLSDYYGPVIYSHFDDADKNYQPDTQKEAYYNFFSDLDTAVELLGNTLSDRETRESQFARFDIVLDGQYSSWVKFANSLRLRLAIRIAMADPEKAKEEFLKGLTNPYGVFEMPKEMAAVSTKGEYLNPLGEINRVWEEVYMNASMESILNGYEDPRRSMFFEPCPADVLLTDRQGNDSLLIPLQGEYRGIRQGTCFSHRLYASHSKMCVNPSTDAILMTAAEVWFLRAEAALRGWSGEQAGDCYERGIEASFSQWGAQGIEEYLNSDKTGADYVDVYASSNNIKARCKVSPRWMEEADDETKLEKIITQKWLAVFPEGCEAWAEQRRTGYPRLFPVKINNSKDGCIDTEIMIRRLNFPGSVKSLDYSLYQRLVQALGSPDHAGSRLWWDKGKNF